ncbi:MAG TPA: phosphoribosylanthranilate isomerase [Verrucomicrobiae bacterium]|nr:phosphoribosylanthranilate isomerase [Verrucomicrobiae bacterium]
MRTRIKFCGCTSPEDALAAVEAGVDAIGMIFADSPRRISPQTARAIARELPPFVTPVGVFVFPTRAEVERAREAVPNLLLQLSGNESPEQAAVLGASIKAIHVRAEGEPLDELRRRTDEYSTMMPLFDTQVDGRAGGTGVPFAWRALEGLARERPIVVAGGLTAANVGGCIRIVRPYAVDVRSGIETDGHKDRAKMRAFVTAVRERDET